MSSQSAMSILGGLEFLLSATLSFIFWKKGLQRRFPAMGAYLALRVVSTPVLSLLLMGNLFASGKVRASCGTAYFFTYWAIYILSAGLLYFISVEVFRSALSSLSGLMKFGLVIFRWAAVVSLVIMFSSVSTWRVSARSIPDFALSMMRSVSLLELCLLAFLCLSMNALRLSARDISFGIALGFGLMSANDFIVVSLMNRDAAFTAPLQFVYQAIVLLALGTWIAFAAMPEPARKPVVMSINSTIYRWNEIAAALGHGTKVAVQQPANSFFLTDVEKVVDKVLTRTNLQGSESKS
jgi:hypothetical protein